MQRRLVFLLFCGLLPAADPLEQVFDRAVPSFLLFLGLTAAVATAGLVI